MQNRRYLHDFQIAVFFAGGGVGMGGGELSYLEDFVVDVWTWKTFFEKRHINNAYSMKNSCNSCFAFCRASHLLFRHISYRTCNDRQLQQWARHVMKIRHRSRDLQMLLLSKRSLWTSMLSWIILLRWLQPKQWYFFFCGATYHAKICVCAGDARLWCSTFWERSGALLGWAVVCSRSTQNPAMNSSCKKGWDWLHPFSNVNFPETNMAIEHHHFQ